MNFVETIPFILVCYGLTLIVVYGSIFNKIRPKYKFFHCSMCMGFWVGIFIYVTMLYSENRMWAFSIPDLFMHGCLSAGTSYLLCSIVDDNGVKVND